jgi:Antitoxin Phd_YefM, type II toxin-antitoxin system
MVQKWYARVLTLECRVQYCYPEPMATIPQKELRNNVGEVLRRAEAGEEITITVSGRPVAQLDGELRDPWSDQ